MKENRTLETPFGVISILIDGTTVPYDAIEGPPDSVLWPEILGIYHITVNYQPDGKEHNIACIFTPSCSYNRGPESGERLECQSFYNDQGFKMSIGTECESWYIDGKRFSRDYDYDVDYLENGMAYVILPETKTNNYVFGIAWVEGVSWDNPTDDELDRSTQTWYAADPSFHW